MNLIKSLQMLVASSRDKVALEAVQAPVLAKGELAKLKGPAIFLDRVSANNRLYNADSVHARVKDLQPRIAVKSLFGELDHPPINDLNRLAYVNMKDVSHRIDALYFDAAKNCYIIEVTILDTPNGRILKTILDSGSPLYVSLRSLLDPAKNVQRDGYVEAWMMLLVTIDFVSQPGFSDAILEPIAVANESMAAVCESYSLTSIINNSNTQKRMQKQFKIVNIAFESIDGALISEPNQNMKDLAASIYADMQEKFVGKFSDDKFNEAYQGLFQGKQFGLYADAAEIVCIDIDDNAVIKFSLDVTDDNQYRLPDAPEFEYRVYEASTDMEPAQAPSAGQEMFAIVPTTAVVATENYTPSDDFVNACNDVLDYMRQNHNIGFDINAFDGIAQQLQDLYGVTAVIDKTGEQPVLKVQKDDQVAKYSLTVEGNAAVVDDIKEYASSECDTPNAATESAPEPVNDHGNDKNKAPDADVHQPGTAVNEEDMEKGQKQAGANADMYRIVDELHPVDTSTAVTAAIEPKSEEQSKIAEECARIFGMPNNRFAGNYAIEHIPTAFKHLWQGCSEAAKQTIALSATKASIATEAQAIKFWSSIDFIALEQSLIRKAAQPAVESGSKPVSNDWRLNLLNAGYNQRKTN